MVRLVSLRNCAACQAITPINLLFIYNASDDLYLIPLSELFILHRESLGHTLCEVCLSAMAWPDGDSCGNC